jgi:hypothetical protein
MSTATLTKTQVHSMWFHHFGLTPTPTVRFSCSCGALTGSTQGLTRSIAKAAAWAEFRAHVQEA